MEAQPKSPSPTPTPCPFGPSFTPDPVGDPACYALYQVVRPGPYNYTPQPRAPYTTATPEPPPSVRSTFAVSGIPQSKPLAFNLDTAVFLLAILAIPILWYGIVGGARTPKRMARFAAGVLLLLGLALLYGYIVH